MAAGENIVFRLLNTFQMLGTAIEDIMPGLNPLDWLVGFTGAVLLKIVVHQKGKKSRMYRRDREYGTARWGVCY
jgi:type IV secretion system protein VirD4